MPEYPELSAMFTDPMILTGVLAACGVIVTRLAFRNHPRQRLVGQVLFFLALTLLLLYQGIVPYEAGPPDVSVLQRIFVGLAKVVWWINAAWALIAFVRVFLIFERQPREGRLIQDLVVGLIYLGMVLSVVAYVFSVPVGTLIATSGVFAIILGLAMQSTLSDVFSGIALNLGRPYAIGDWIVVSDGIEGRVVETNWRATHLLNSANDLVILPNSGLAKATLTNMSSPERSHGGKLTVRFMPTMTPAAICDVMRDVLLSCTSILAVPPPSVQIKALDAHAVEIELSFRVKDLSVVSAAQNEIFDLVYRHAKAAGLKLAAAADAPADASMLAQPGEKAQHRSTPLRLIDAIALFASLTEDEREALAGTMTRRTYRKDEIIVRQGETLHALMIVRTGVLDVTRRQHEREIELNRLAPGDCFGEGGLLTGASEAGTIRALTFVVVYEIAQEGLAPIMRDRPAIAEELGLTLSRRAETERHLFEPRATTDSAGSVQSLATKIRHLFELPHVE
jgi:small-conductance mechanosensitive channel/CRP-like cAMP-binding protein